MKKILFPYCKCGCGQRTKTAGKQYVHGHHTRGKSRSAETRRKISEGNMGQCRPHTEATKRKISKTMKGIPKSPFSDIHKKHISEALKGRLLSDEHKRKIGEACKGHRGVDWKKRGGFSDSHRRKIGLVWKGKKRGPMPEETKRKLSEANMGQKPWNKGQKASAESRQRMSDANKGKTLSKETKEKLSAIFKGRISPNKGNHHSPETKKQMRVSRIRYVEETRLKGMPLYPTIGKLEQSCLDFLEANCNFKIQRQKPACGYFLDGYIKELNLAIEFDERIHEIKSKQPKDKLREKNIRKELKCRFFRIKELQWQHDPTAVKDRFAIAIKAMQLNVKVIA